MNRAIPLCVDLDGTLIRTDLLLESFLLLLKHRPLCILLVPFWLLRGKAALKHEIASRITLDVSLLPYRGCLLAWLQEERQRGRSLWLCTASNHRLAEAVARHLGCFDGVLASDNGKNLSGRNKARVLVGRFGDKGFDYCGNAVLDRHIWARAQAAVVIGGRSLVRVASRVTQVERVFEKRPYPALRALFKALRPHQWAKNLLVLVPVLAAHHYGDAAQIRAALWAFLAFGLCASSVYLLNDMLDLEADRQHPRKRYRPFAAGDLSLEVGLTLQPLLLVAAGMICLLLPWQFAAVLAGYYGMTLAYSLLLKRVVMLDALTLAGLYTIRLVAGGAATAVPLSFWMMLFSVFLFLSLALVKRYAELLAMREAGQLTAAGRGYELTDLPILQSLGSSSGYLSVLVLTLYINSPEIQVLYRQPKAIWLLSILLLYWISRIWLKTHRGEMHDDPIVFALKDKVSLLIGVMAVLVVVVAV